VLAYENDTFSQKETIVEFMFTSLCMY